MAIKSAGVKVGGAVEASIIIVTAPVALAARLARAVKAAHLALHTSAAAAAADIMAVAAAEAVAATVGSRAHLIRVAAAVVVAHRTWKREQLT